MFSHKVKLKTGRIQELLNIAITAKIRLPSCTISSRLCECTYYQNNAILFHCKKIYILRIYSYATKIFFSSCCPVHEFFAKRHFPFFNKTQTLPLFLSYCIILKFHKSALKHLIMFAQYFGFGHLCQKKKPSTVKNSISA